MRSCSCVWFDLDWWSVPVGTRPWVCLQTKPCPGENKDGLERQLDGQLTTTYGGGCPAWATLTYSTLQTNLPYVTHMGTGLKNKNKPRYSINIAGMEHWQSGDAG